MPTGVYKPLPELNQSAAADLVRNTLAASEDAYGALSGVARKVKTVAVNTTLTAADSGALILVTAADLVITLPPTANGLHYTFALAASGLSASTGLSISPDAADQIVGNGFTAADNKDAILAGATDRAGDAITLIADNNVGWYIVNLTGTWTREA